MKPLVNIIYSKGSYYVYQADSLMKEPGLTVELHQKSKIDRYFVTQQIKSIAMKASIVVKSTKSKELDDAFKNCNMNPSKYVKTIDSQYSDEEEDTTPIGHEAKLEVNSNPFCLNSVTYLCLYIGSPYEHGRCDPPWSSLLHHQGELD